MHLLLTVYLKAGFFLKKKIVFILNTIENMEVFCHKKTYFYPTVGKMQYKPITK